MIDDILLNEEILKSPWLSKTQEKPSIHHRFVNVSGIPQMAMAKRPKILGCSSAICRESKFLPNEPHKKKTGPYFPWLFNRDPYIGSL